MFNSDEEEPFEGSGSEWCPNTSVSSNDTELTRGISVCNTQEPLLEISYLQSVSQPEPSTFNLTVESNEQQKPKSRKRIRNEAMWKRNVNKFRRVSGKTYINTKNVIVPEKLLKLAECPCSLKCHTYFNEEKLKHIFENFYALNNHNLQTSYLCGQIKVTEKKRTYKKSDGESRRNKTRLYTLPGENNIDRIVCKNFFKNILQVSDGRITRALKCKGNQDTLTTPNIDKRGYHVPSNKTSTADVDLIKAFIEKIPKYNSHYSRNKNLNREYLAPDLNITKLFNLYVESSSKPVSKYVFTKVFSENFNLHFRAPISDSCKKCDALKIKIDAAENLEQKQILEAEKDLHLRKAEAARKGMTIDSKNNNSEVAVIAFDLMKTLPTPVISTGICYYKRQLWTYCLGVHDLITALEFSIEPSDVVIPEGHSVLLQCNGLVQEGALKEGKTAPNIRWRGPDGQDIGIVGDTFRTQLKNGSLYISSVEENRGLTGAYQCLLSVDGIGTIVSRSAIVSIARLPDLNQDFIELYLLPGQTAYFRCMIGQIQSGVQYNVQWLKDEQPLQLDKVRMIIMPNGALEIDEIKNFDRGIYQCNVTFGNISKLSSKTNLNIKKTPSSIAAAINESTTTIKTTIVGGGGNSNLGVTGSNENVQAPSFLVGPSPQTVKEGDVVTLNCVANGIPKPQIRWLRNGVEIDLNDLDSRFLIIGSGSLQISSAEDIDSANYQCRSSNSVDSLDAEATVQVQVPPKFIHSPMDKIAYEKEELEFECSIWSKPKPVIKWLKNGDIITPNEYMQIVGGHNLKILGLLKSDAGMFQCVGSNPAGSIQASAQLKITQPGKHKKQSQTTKSLQTPSLTNTNKKGIFKSGDTLMPRSKSTDNKIISKSALDSLLSKDKRKFIDYSPDAGNESIEKIKNIKNNKSTKDNTETYDDYDYYDDLSDDNDDNDNDGNQKFDNVNIKNKKHNINNDHDKNDSFHIPIDVDNEEDDENDGDTDDDEDNEDDDDDDDDNDDDEDEEYIVKFEKGDDPDKILNSFNDKKFKLKKHQEQENEKKNSKTTKLTDPNISQHQEVNSYHDLYSLQSNITKNLNSNLDASQLASVPLPGPPRDLLAQIVKPRFVALSWMEPLKNPDEVISYLVYYKMHTSERERKIATKSRDDQQVNIQSLLPGKTYQFRVVGNSNHGPGESSEVLEVSTQPEENIAGPPQNVEGYSVSHKEILLKWQPPTVTNGIISKYRIYYAEDESGAEMYADSTTLMATLSELRPYTEYTITVVPFNQNGMGDSSNEIKVKTFSSIPSEPPNNVTLEVTSSTSITIHWEPPTIEDRNGQINGYKIRYRKLKESPQVKTTAANVRHYELNNLDRSSEYQIKIAAMTVNGSGPFTEWHRVVTLENDLDETQVPGKPGWVSIRPGAGKIALHWAPPAQQDIKIRSYILGWGKGIPDENTIELKESHRYYEIKDLDINSEYVISLRARNVKGDGPPIYDNVKTREEESLEQPAPLEVPVGLRAITMSSSSIVVYWIDTTLSKSQHVIDNRHYSVRYSTTGSNRYRFLNTSDLNCMLTDLKPNTQYEFAVKVVKGRRESAWSMSVLNSTLPHVPLSPPRDLIVRVDEYNPQNVLLQWQPPKHIIGQITGYSVYYTTDINKRDRDWLIEQVIGDTNTAVIKGLKPYTTYYFKIMTKTVKGSTPFSALISYTTGPAVLIQETNILSKGFDNQMILYTIIGVTAVLLFIALAVIVLVCNKKPPISPEHNKKSYQKNNLGAPKPPDLWIHHEQMELKNIDKSHHTPEIITGCSDGASSSGAMTLPRSAMHEYDSESNGGPAHITNSLDKRSYVPGYMTTSMNSTMERPQYPRTQYNVSTRSHMNVDTTLSQQSLSQPQNNSLAQTPEHPYNAYEQMPNYTNPNTPYIPPGMNMDSSKSRGHPLKSFSVPGPPPLNVSTPVISSGSGKHVPAVTIRPQNTTSPYKKPTFVNSTPTNRLQSGPSVAHSTDEIQRLQPSTSTEELNQEMANLEGLMKDLSAITASEFEC